MWVISLLIILNTNTNNYTQVRGDLCCCLQHFVFLQWLSWKSRPFSLLLLLLLSLLYFIFKIPTAKRFYQPNSLIILDVIQACSSLYNNFKINNQVSKKNNSIGAEKNQNIVILITRESESWERGKSIVVICRDFNVIFDNEEKRDKLKRIIITQ